MEADDGNEENAEEEQRIKFDDSFDHLSQYDPDDQLIKSDRSMSIIESFMSKGKGHGNSSALSESSEFSIISSAKVKSLVSSTMSLANKKMNQISFIEKDEDDDNYVQDIIAQKIIYYLSLWSEDMRGQLDLLKEKGILQHKNSGDADQEKIDETDFII